MRKRIAVSFGATTKRDPYLNALRVVGLDFDADTTSLEGLDGLLPTGGTDVDPALYGEPRQPGTDEPDVERDSREKALVLDALRRDLPILAICRGMQLLNVALGGTLNQHIEGHRVRGQSDVHCIEIIEGSKLALIVEPGMYRVNSRHHQSVARLGEGLVVSAKAGDVIEGLELPTHSFVVGVQWHPEDRLDTLDRQLFKAFAEVVHMLTATAPA